MQERRLRRTLYILVAIAFGLMHVRNLAPMLRAIAQSAPGDKSLALQSGKVIIPIKSVLIASVVQCTMTTVISLRLFSPLFAHRGLAAAVAAHATWNLFSPVFMGVLVFKPLLGWAAAGSKSA
eukprot:500883-Prymnesium_polylepis.1